MQADGLTFEEIADDIIHKSYGGKYTYDYSGLILSQHQLKRRHNHEILTEDLDLWMGRHGVYGRAYNKYRRDLNSRDGADHKPHRMSITKRHYDPGFTEIKRGEGTITLEEYNERTGANNGR